MKSEKQISTKLNLEISELNTTIQQLNSKLSELDEALSLSLVDVETKNTEIENLKVKLDVALKEKIGELSEYRSEFFGRLKEILKNQKEINIVGDRFVLQSEILFMSGSAEIGTKEKERLSEISSLFEVYNKKNTK